MKVVTNCDLYKGSLYYRKRIYHKYLITGKKKVEIRKSLRSSAKRYYTLLLKDQNELIKLIAYINNNLELYLKLRNKVNISEIYSYIHILCEQYYYEVLQKTNSLEINRTNKLEHINENGVQEGYAFQSLAKEYKTILLASRNPSNTEKTIDIGKQIVQRSSITKEQLLQINPNSLISFYTKLIRAEKTILENDIFLYISNNLYQFTPLITDLNQSKDAKVHEAFHTLQNLIQENEPQIDYLGFINKQKNDILNQPTSLLSGYSKEDLINEIFTEITLREEIPILDTKIKISTLLDQFITYKGYSNKRSRTARRSIQYLVDFLEGNDKEYQALNIEEVSVQHILEFEKLLIELPVQSRAKQFSNKRLFDLVKLRKETAMPRIQSNTLKGIEAFIKDFWKYLAKNITSLNLSNDTMSVLHLAHSSKTLRSLDYQKEAQVRSFTVLELNIFILNTYNKESLKKILLSQPRNFWLFIIGLLYGMRHEEILLMALEDIKVQKLEDKNIYYIYLNENQPYQHLKNINAHRNIPIIDILIELGFLDYVKRRKEANKTTLFDFPKSSSSASNAFFKRHIQKNFPAYIANNTNKNSKGFTSYLQFRSLRKNFANFLFEKNRTEYDTTQNKEKIMGHKVEGEKARYMGRLEPYKAYQILNAIEYSSIINFDVIKQTTDQFYKSTTELDWLLQQKEFYWNEDSYVRPTKGRRV